MGKQFRCQTAYGTSCFSAWKQTSLHALTVGHRKQRRITRSFIFCYSQKLWELLLNTGCEVLVFFPVITVILSPNSSAYGWTWMEWTIYLCPLTVWKTSACLFIGKHSHKVSNRCSFSLEMISYFSYNTNLATSGSARIIIISWFCLPV